MNKYQTLQEGRPKILHWAQIHQNVCTSRSLNLWIVLFDLLSTAKPCDSHVRGFISVQPPRTVHLHCGVQVVPQGCGYSKGVIGITKTLPPKTKCTSKSDSSCHSCPCGLWWKNIVHLSAPTMATHLIIRGCWWSWATWGWVKTLWNPSLYIDYHKPAY